jgi:hypothetical protein
VERAGSSPGPLYNIVIFRRRRDGSAVAWMVIASVSFASDGDFVFPSLKAAGRVPLSASIFVVDHLRPAAKKAGVKIKVEPKTAQGILHHAKIQTTLDLYAQDDGDETRAAQGEYLTALGVGTQMVR